MLHVACVITGRRFTYSEPAERDGLKPHLYHFAEYLNNAIPALVMRRDLHKEDGRPLEIHLFVNLTEVGVQACI